MLRSIVFAAAAVVLLLNISVDGASPAYKTVASSRHKPTPQRGNARRSSNRPPARGVAGREHHPGLHDGYLPGDIFCTIDFSVPMQDRSPPRTKAANFYLLTDAADYQTWNGLEDMNATRVFVDPEFKALLLYTDGSAPQQSGGDPRGGTAQPSSAPSFSVFASLEPEPNLSDEEKKEQLKQTPRIQMMQTRSDCMTGAQDRSKCVLWEKCALDVADGDVVFNCGDGVDSPVPMALTMPRCAASVPPRHSSRSAFRELQDTLSEQLAKQCNWYLHRWMLPFPDDDAAKFDSDRGILLGKALCVEFAARTRGRDWRPVAFWMKFGLARFLSAARQGPPAISILQDLLQDIHNYTGWNGEGTSTPNEVQWDLLCDALAIFSQSSQMEMYIEALGIIDYLRSSAKFEKQVESFRVYLTNQEAMLALKVGDLARAAKAVEVLFHDTPEERYSEALVLGFMAINIHRYSLNPTKVFQDFLDPRMPNDDEMQQLHSLLEDVEAFYKARLDSADMSYEGFKVPRHETQLPDGTLKPGAVHTMTSSGLTEIPVSAWTPDRLDHMPTPEEFQGYYLRREPFIVSLPSQSPSRPNVPTKKVLEESLTLDDERKQLCTRNLEPFGWEASCNWTADYFCEIAPSTSVALAVPSTGPDGKVAFAGTARPKRHDASFCDFVRAIDATNSAGPSGRAAGESHLCIDESASMSEQLSKCYFDAGSPRQEKENIRQFPLNRMDPIPIPKFADTPEMADHFSTITMWLGHSLKDADIEDDQEQNMGLEDALRRSMPGKSGLHYDNLDNLHAVVRGRKRWRIVSPNDALKLDFIIPPDNVTKEGFINAQPRPDMYKFYGFETRFSIVGSATEGVDAAAFPRPVTATQSVFFIDEGETLYLPSGWAHEVESEGLSISYTFWLHSPAKWIEHVAKVNEVFPPDYNVDRA